MGLNREAGRTQRNWYGNRVAQSYYARAVTFIARGFNSPLRLEIAMLGWAITFLIIALIAGVLGFGVIAGTAATIAKILFVVFLVLFVIGLIMGRRGTSV